MSKAMLNYVVDLVIAAAFLAAAVSGIVFLLPTGAMGSSAAGEPAVLGVPMAAWSTVHEYAALAMIGAIILHLVLHWRWVVKTTRRTFRAGVVRGTTFVNYVVDVVIAAAFLASAVSGIVFLLPSAASSISATGEPTVIGVSTATWSLLHEWSSLVMIAGGVLHVVLHWRWVVKMTRRAVGARSRGPAPSTTPAAARAAGVHVLGPQTAAAVAGPGSGERGPRPVDGHVARGGERRISRRTFLAGTAAACAGAAFVVVLGRGGDQSTADGSATASADAAPAEGQSNGNGNGRGDGTAAHAEDSDPDVGTDDGSADGTASGTTEGEDQTASEPAPSSERVTVDAGRCTGCGDCLSACRYGVFALEGGSAVAADPDACVLCGRCARVCPTQAITLRA